MPSEISQTRKDKYCMVSLLCGIYNFLKVKFRETESGKVIAGDWGGGGRNRDMLVKGHKLSGIRGIRSEDLV